MLYIASYWYFLATVCMLKLCIHVSSNTSVVYTVQIIIFVRNRVVFCLVEGRSPMCPSYHPLVTMETTITKPSHRMKPY